ncbi:MAG: insulinase family protein [Elusimicrobia bacterium]|nr:insulinase family protein [Elusimicrobiota bacterium]
MTLAGLLLAAVLPAAAASRPDMGRPPPSGAWSPFKAPPRVHFSLPNGLKVVYAQDARVPLLTVRLAVRGGTALGGPRGIGLVEALAALLTEGTELRDARAVAEAAEAAGGSLRGEATEDHIMLAGDGLAEKGPDLLALMAEAATQPSFPEAEVALRRANMSSELTANRAEPDWLARRAFQRALYGEHPYGVFAPDEAAIALVERGALLRLHNKLFTPDNAVLAAVGAPSAEEFRRLAESAFGAWSGAQDLPPVPLPSPEPRRGRRLVSVERPGSAQAVFRLGAVTVGETHPDFEALRAAHMVLGGSFAARLSTDLREDKGWTYGIYSGIDEGLAASALTVSSKVRGEVARRALDAVVAHIERLRGTLPSKPELEQAKNLLTASLVRGLETQEGLADAFLHDALYGLPDGHLDGFVARVRAVTPEQVRDAARRWLKPADLTFAVVGDPQVLKALEGLGPISPAP